MAYPIDRKTLASASAAATGDVTIPNADGWLRHRLYVVISNAATVKAKVSPDDGATWFQVGSDVTATGILEFNGPYRDAKVTWASNNGTVTIIAEQVYEHPATVV